MIRCHHTTGICSICGLCSRHCVGHTNMRASAAPVMQEGFAQSSKVTRSGQRVLTNADGSEYKGPQCAAAMRMAEGGLIQVGRVDTRLIPEEQAAAEGKPRRKRVQVAA